MKELWLAFIVICNGIDCEKTRTYSEKHFLTVTLCREYARNWAISSHLKTDFDYGYGCKLNNYEPKDIQISK